MRSRYTICLLAGLILLAGFILPAASLAGTNTWTTNGPSGGEVLSLALSPNFASDHTLFAGTYDGGAFKSTDAGASWSAVNTGLISPEVTPLALSPNFAADSTLFAGTWGGGVFKSTDRGSNWSAVNTGLTGMNVYSLALSPNFASDSTLFAGTNGGVFKSTDGGSNWSAVNTGLTNMDVWFLALSPNFASDHTLFAGTNGGGAFKSTNAGASWSAVSTGLANTDVRSLALSPNFASDSTLFAGTYGGGAFKSTNAGASWSAVNTGPTNTHVLSLALSPNFASDHTLFAGAVGGVFSYTFSPRNYYWAWYDATGGMQNWVLMANPSGAAGNLRFDLDIAGTPRSPGDLGSGVGVVPPGKALTPMYLGVTGGPVKATSVTGDKAIVSQRSLMGNSFEEVLGTDEARLSDHYFWSWYDELSSGYTNWILIANPSATETVSAVISFTNLADGQPVSQVGDIAPGANWNPTFPGKMGGPVEVKAYKAGGSWPTDKMNVIASQRVLSNNGSAFNEVPGIPAADLSSDYLWTWYDNASPGATDWVLVANPGVDHTGASQGTVSATVKIGALTYGPYSIAPGHNVTPTFPGIADGPVEVTSTGGDVIATQRSLFGPSFEEVPGYPRANLASDYHWTWYDQQSAGSTNWVLVANPGDTPVTYQIKIAGQVQPTTADNPGTIPAHGKVTPTFPTEKGGPVEVTSTGGPVMASQRVLWNGYFNEVLGTVLN